MQETRPQGLLVQHFNAHVGIHVFSFSKALQLLKQKFIDLPRMKKYILEPTNRNLERLKKVKNGEVYWHTADFFQVDPRLKEEMWEILEIYLDIIEETKEEDVEEATRKVRFLVGRMLVKAARKIGISPQDARDQFDNCATATLSPICIWRKDESGEMQYSLMGALPSEMNGLRSR